MLDSAIYENNNNNNNNNSNRNNNNAMRMSSGRLRVSCGLDAFGCVIFGCSTVLIMCLIGFPSHVEAAAAGETVAAAAPAAEPVGICAMPGCNCTIIAHHWINVKCVFADYQDVELLEGAVPADALEVEVSHCRELRIHSGAFTGGAQLKRVHVTGIYSLVAKRQAFHNISGPNPLLEVSECNRVVLESHAFKNARGTLSVSISRCKHVEIKPNAFSWLLKISVRDVPTLELSSNAFKFDAPPYGRHGPATKIMFQSVKISELPSSVFPSAAAEVRMDDVFTRVIRTNAFCAMSILSVTISNASIFEIEDGAFSNRTLIPSLEFADVKVRTMRTGALQSAVNNLTIQYSRLNEVEAKAIDVSVATVTFNNNEFHDLKTNSIVLKQWNRIAIDHNLFVSLEPDAISAAALATGAPHLEFSFRDNRVNKAQPGSLRFASVAVSQQVNTARVGNNYFEKDCSCLMDDWMREITGSDTTASWMMDSSFCVAGEWLERCLKIPQRYLAMRNYTRTICTPDGNITCKEPSAKPPPSVSPPSVGPHVYPRQNSYFDVEMSDPEQLEREKRIIVLICVAAVFAVVAIILTSGVIYMRRRGVCPKLTSGPLMNLASSWLSPSSGMTAATSARSISRLSVHEYAGLRPETRILDVEAADREDQDEDPLDPEGYAYTENKATQTLPEELTEEYLRDLRERLNDPDNYSQARDMIEHLYDLIKVEESCNNNNDRGPTSNHEDENAYDVIGPRTRRARGNPRPSVNVGTRVPSLERLLPTDVRARPPIAEYTEPRDLRTNDQNHLYAELPGDETVPSTSRLSQPILAGLAGRAPQPLPPDVVNDHLINNTENLLHERKYAADTTRNASEYADLKLDDGLLASSTSPSGLMTRDEPANPNKGQGRPLSFLKALGESILGATKISNKRPTNTSLLCEYTDPTDITTHLYSELPEPPATSCQVGKMANRPLPTKPDQETDAVRDADTGRA